MARPSVSIDVNDDREAVRPEALAAARAHPCAWARLVSGGEWLPAKHLRWLGDKLMGVAKGEILRLAVSMPPGSGKSQVISRALPAWWLGVFPRDRVLVVSASSELTREWSRAARDDFAQWGEPVFGSTASATASASRWAVYDARSERRTGGSLVGGGIGGTIIGRRANVIICDDWIRSDVEANNAALREQHYRWFQSVALTRLLPGGRVILVSTRWHADDLLGRLEAQQARGEAAEPYVFVNLPAIAEQDDPLGRKPGEALWPEMWPASALDVKRREVGPYVWSSLFQGRPVPAEGGMFKRSWFGYFDHDALTGRVTVEGIGTSDTRDLVKFHTVDLAVSTKTTADYTVVATFTVHKAWGLAFVLDLRRVRVEGPDLLPLLEEVHEKHGGVFFMEKIGPQLALLQTIRRAGLPVREVAPVGDKRARALPLTAAIEGKRLLLPRNASWRADLEAELLDFPSGKHDDQVDALSYGAAILTPYLRRPRDASAQPPAPRRYGFVDDSDGWLIGR